MILYHPKISQDQKILFYRKNPHWKFKKLTSKISKHNKKIIFENPRELREHSAFPRTGNIEILESQNMKISLMRLKIQYHKIHSCNVFDLIVFNGLWRSMVEIVKMGLEVCDEFRWQSFYAGDRDPGTDRSELVRDFQKFVSPGPVQASSLVRDLSVLVRVSLFIHTFELISDWSWNFGLFGPISGTSNPFSPELQPVACKLDKTWNIYLKTKRSWFRGKHWYPIHS